MKEVNYSYILTEEDKLRIAFQKKRGKIVYFIVQYYALIDSRWKSIMRFDTCHGYAHQHIFHRRKKEYIIKLTEKDADLNVVFTQSSNHIRSEFKKIKENYLRT